MVGKRSGSTTSDDRKNYSSTSRSSSSQNDIESGGHARSNGQSNGDARPRPDLWRFKDAATTALADARREELKKALLSGVDRKGLEKFRKSDDELKQIKKKNVRKFYEAQNARLNDWLELDAIVMHVADDALESMDPDPDHDGFRERTGGIQAVAGNVSQLLPEDEQEKRRKAAWKAKWAININVIANVILLAGKLFAVFSSSSLSLIASLVDSALDLLCTLIIWGTNQLVQWRLNALQKKFPVGRRRLEPLGILVFSIIMVLSFAQILQESVEKLLPMEGKAEELPAIAVAALLATIVVKGIIWFVYPPGVILLRHVNTVAPTVVSALGSKHIHNFGITSTTCLRIRLTTCPFLLGLVVYPSKPHKSKPWHKTARRTSYSTHCRFYSHSSVLKPKYGGSTQLALDSYPCSSSTTGARHPSRMSHAYLERPRAILYRRNSCILPTDSAPLWLGSRA